MLAASVALGAALVFARLGSAPGLHGDEAWVGLRALDVLNGARPLTGMNDYTGPLHQYLIAPFVKIFGASTSALRFPGAALSLVGVLLYFRVMRRLFDARVAGWATLFLVTLPFFALFHRIANEVFILNPVLALGSLDLLLFAETRAPRERRGLHLLAGVLLGLGLWNHLIFASWIFALGAVLVWEKRSQSWKSPAPLWVVAGALVALLPRLIHQLGRGRAFEHGLALPILHRLAEWPVAFAEVLHGDFLFRRFTGELRAPTFNYTALALVVALAVTITAARKTAARSPRRLLVFGFALALATVLVSPAIADRYFLLPLYLVPALLALLVDVARGVRARVAVSIVATLFIVAGAARLIVNFFVPFAETGGRNSMIFFGGYTETSNHYVDSRALAERLVALRARRICAEFLLATPLQYLLHDQTAMNVSWDEHDCLRAAAAREPANFVVLYHGGLPRWNTDQFPGAQVAFEDAHFTVLAL